MAARQESGVAARDLAEDILAVRLHIERQISLDPVVINQQLGFVYHCEGVTVFPKGAVQIELLLHDGVALEKLSRIDFEGVAQRCRIGCGREVPEIDRAICVSVAGNDIEPHRGRPVGRVVTGLACTDRTHDLSIVISVNPQQVVEQFLVLPRACRELGNVRILVLEALDGRKRGKPLDEIAAFGEWGFGLGEAENEIVVDPFGFGLFERDLRLPEIEFGEFEVFFLLQRLEPLDRDVVRPRQVQTRRIGNRRIGFRHIGFGGPIRALLCPGIGVFDCRIRDQVFEIAGRFHVLRRERGASQPQGCGA